MTGRVGCLVVAIAAGDPALKLRIQASIRIYQNQSFNNLLETRQLFTSWMNIDE